MLALPIVFLEPRSYWSFNMRNIVAGLILIMTLPMVCKAEKAATNTPGVLPAEPKEVQIQEVVPSPSPEAVSPGSHPGKTSEGGSAGSPNTQSEAFNICLRATQRFEQQEKAKAKGTSKTVSAPLSASCKTELKPASYWLCMDKESITEVDFNVAHTHCAK
jgi:hypothetical protein